MDAIISQISSCFSTIRTTADRFSFIWNGYDEDTLSTKANELAKAYPNDLDKDVLMDEIQSMRRFIATLLPDDESETYSLTLLNAIYKKGLNTIFPQVCVALRMFT